MIKAKFKRLIRLIRKNLRKNPDKFLKEVSGVVHIGANSGQERGLYRIYQLDVIWIEPIPEVFEQLIDNLKDFKNQRAFQALVTDFDNKKYEFHIANNNGGSSSILDLKQHKDIWPEVHYTKNVELKSTTLTTLFKKEYIDLKNYQALIMDTQGSELHVLQGSLPILNNFKFIKLEVPDFESYEGCCQLSDIKHFMAEHGYKEFSRNKFASRTSVGSYFDIVYKRKD
ncbi:methyltransferase, FkbM family [Algoriphagus locisalis]|uniref:Methyltransferase, FkbM family n=1 Tax=Algoriphagus locisalis TaxID=305507 RepID=A0A1I6XVJ8_9BACT|nr:FkbM family methyltransferase [Algoriphagus locisalis]SFT41921.1 methyltransferase, FkbM family [Algoriphagus locisalis]